MTLAKTTNIWKRIISILYTCRLQCNNRLYLSKQMSKLFLSYLCSLHGLSSISSTLISSYFFWEQYCLNFLSMYLKQACTVSQRLIAVGWLLSVRESDILKQCSTKRRLTFPQTTSFRLLKTQRVCRPQFQISWKWWEILQTVRKHCEKGEIARYEQFLLFLQCFQRTSAADT